MSEMVIKKKNILQQMKPDINDGFAGGYSLDMLEQILTPAEYTSLHFYVRNTDIGMYQGQTYVYYDVYQKWAIYG